MMKIFKRILLIVLMCSLFICATPFSAFCSDEEEYVEGAYTYTVKDGNASIVKADESLSGDITIPSSLGGYPVHELGFCSFKNCAEITSIIIPDSVKVIQEEAFSACSNLENIKIPNSITLMSEAIFLDCKNLKSVTVPEKIWIIYGGTFSNCDSLTSITLPNSITKIMIGAFENLPSLSDIYFAGNEDEWEDITIEESNEDLFNADIHFVSQREAYGNDYSKNYDNDSDISESEKDSNNTDNSFIAVIAVAVAIIAILVIIILLLIRKKL